MPRGIPNKKPAVDPMEVGGPDDVEVEVKPKSPAAARGLPHIAVAFAQALEPIVIPGKTKAGPTPRIDPLEDEWEGWRIVVSGPSLFLIAPKGWTRGIIDATGGPGESFLPYSEALGWEGPEDVRQVFEFPRGRFVIRYFIADTKGDTDFADTQLVEAFRSQPLAAPDARVRAIAEERKAEEAAELERQRQAEQRRAQRLAPKPPPKVVAAAKKKKADEDDDAGMGDEGPVEEPEDDEDE